jgi:hypothetical protein
VVTNRRHPPARPPARPRWLGSNLLRTAAIPATLSRLSCLRKLWLPSNHLVELPEAVCSIPGLEWL